MDEVGRLRAIGHHVTIAAYGMAASAAGWMLECGDERVIGAHAQMLIHQVSGEARGKIYDHEIAEAQMKGMWEECIKLLTARSHGKLTRQIILDHTSHSEDWWITAQEALDYGLVDRIESVPAFK